MSGGCDPQAVLGPRRVLYYGPGPGRFADLIERAGAEAGAPARWIDGEAHLRAGDLETRWLPSYEPEATLARLQDTYISLLLLDLRQEPGEPGRHIEEGRRLLALLDDPADIEARYGFHRILALVSGPDGPTADGLLLELGRWGLEHVLRQRRREGFSGSVLAQIGALLGASQPGATALCAAGGGITGIYFEQGALKCLADCLPPGALHGIDQLYGISAGAVVTSVLRVGYSVDEFMAAIAGCEGGRIPPMNLSLIRLGHLNLPDIRRRAGVGARAAGRAAWDLLRHRQRPDADALFLGLTSLVGAPFRSDHFGEILRGVFAAPGATDDFRELPRPLFIGASDQDLKKHVLFGAPPREHVPIHLAVQASLSINPAFAAVPIEGRYYEDGAVTQTSHFTEAIRRGADLVISLDPFVPYVSRDAGSVNHRGVLYNIDQDIRALSYTRFQRTRDWALRRNPQVSSYTFLPSNRLRGLLSLNPMDHRPYLPIWKGAYLSTLARIKTLCHRLRGDLRLHGLSLELERAEAVADRLAATERPQLSDFYPDGRLEIPRPPLALHPQGAAGRRARGRISETSET